MLPSTGYFNGINCPFYDSGLCERPYCHFRHVRKEQQTLSNEGIGHGAIFHQIVSEAVKEVLQHTDSSNGQQAVHFVESEAKAADESDSNKPAQKVTYNPTPISQLEKITSADAESDSTEQKRRHIPVPYTPRKPASLPRPVETNGDSKPFIYIPPPPPVQYLPGTNDGALADPYMPKGGTESKEKYVPGTETEQQEYKPVENKTTSKVNYVPSDKSVKKKRILEYKPKPTKVCSNVDAPVVTYQPTPRSQVPCFSSDEEEPDAKKKRKLSSDLNSLDELGAEFDIIGQILDEEKSKDELRKNTDNTSEDKDSKNSKDSSDLKADSPVKKDKTHKSDKHEKTKSGYKDKDKKSRDKHDKSKSLDRQNSHKTTIKDKEKERKKDKVSHKDKKISEKKSDHSGSKSSSEKKVKTSEGSKSSEKSSSRSKSKSHEKKDRHSEHKSTHKGSKEKSRSKDNKDKRKEKTENSYNISEDEFDNVINFNEDIEAISESDEEAIALQCKKIFEEYVPLEKPKNIEDLPKEDSNSEEYIPTKKRISRTIDKNIKVVPKAPMKPDFKKSAAEKMAERLTKIREFHASRNSSSDSTVTVPAIQPSLQHSSVTPVPTTTPSKIRIAHVPYASFMLNAKKTIPYASLTSKSEPSTSTAIQTVKKGTQRLAHMPNEKFIDRPGVLEPLASKIPANVRSTYLNMMIDECLKIYLTTSDAYARAQHEELATSKKCTAIQIYKNSAVLAVSRLRKEVHECNGIKKSGSDCSTLQNIPTAISGTSNNTNAGSWSIENKHKKNGPNINELKGAKFYGNISKWILSEEQLQDNGFPRPHPNGNKGRAMIYSQNRKNPPKGIFRPCSRCGKEYTVDKKGFPTIKEECIYHPNRKYRYRGEVKYQCCSQDGMSDGCCVAPSHVYEYVDFDNLKGYVRTMAPERAMDDYGVYSLDCEMCYTTQGLDLTRITVIDSACKVIYETLIKPLHPIIDYNTRYSGITEEHMANVRTTLLDVQATLLSMFNSKTILIGHSLESDFKALKIIHDTVIDTSVLFPHKMGPPYKRALRNLSSEYLKKIIQNSVEGHDSAEDATVCMELLHYKLKEDLKTR